MARVVTTFLAPKPQWWVTLTFRRSTTSCLSAMGALRSWLSQWARASLRAGGQPPIKRLVWCVELQLRGTAHIHALCIGHPEHSGPHCASCFRKMGYNRSSPLWWVLKESWFHHHGIARVYAFDTARAGGVSAYVAKYMYKDGGEHGLWEHGKDF